MEHVYVSTCAFSQHEGCCSTPSSFSNFPTSYSVLSVWTAPTHTVCSVVFELLLYTFSPWLFTVVGMPSKAAYGAIAAWHSAHFKAPPCDSAAHGSFSSNWRFIKGHGAPQGVLLTARGARARLYSDFGVSLFTCCGWFRESPRNLKMGV